MEFGECANKLVCVLAWSAKVFYYEWEDVVGRVSPSFAECCLVCCVTIPSCALVEGVGVGSVWGCDGNIDVDGGSVEVKYEVYSVFLFIRCWCEVLFEFAGEM